MYFILLTIITSFLFFSCASSTIDDSGNSTIIEELKKCGSNVKVYDPWCDPKEAKKEFNISLCRENELKPADAVVLAVAHSQFKQWSIDRWRSFLKVGGILSDVKNVAPTKELVKYGHRVWRL